MVSFLSAAYEAGHWLEGHESDPAYGRAVAHDEANGAATRGPWEQDGDGRGLK